MIPFADLTLSPEVQSKVDDSISSIMSSCRFIGSTQFEGSFADYIGTNYCIGVGNGTDAIEIAIESIGIKDAEIIVPALTAVPTAEAVIRSGNHVVFCDVDESTLTMDPVSLQSVITLRTKAVIPVHLYGQPCDMTAIRNVVDRLWIIEDCSHAHGASYHGDKVGYVGDIGIFSFYPTKPLGAFGDAGAITTDYDSIADQCYRIRNHGRLARDDFETIGRNSRMDGIQSAVLAAKLPYLDSWNESRNAIAAQYKSCLDCWTQAAISNTTHAYHQFVIQVDNRDTITEQLSALGIGTLIHYPYIIPELLPYQSQGKFPVAFHASRRILSLPIHLNMTEDNTSFIINTLQELLP